MGIIILIDRSRKLIKYGLDFALRYVKIWSYKVEISSQMPKTSLYDLLNSQTSKEKDLPKQSVETQKIPPQTNIKENPKSIPIKKEDDKRETYGLLVLELMSNDEYNAFKRATAGMSEGQKMLAAQSLYSLTNFYNGKFNSLDKQDMSNSHEKNAQKAFGIQAQNLNNFLERFKNAYINTQQVDIIG